MSRSAPRPARTGLAFASSQVQSVALQVAGSAATLGAALWVSWRMGLAAQGEFGLAKSWFDAAAVLCACGLPQGLLHLQYRLKVPAQAIWPGMRLGLAGLSLVTVAVSWALYASELTLAAAVVLSLPFGIGLLLARSILLAQRGVVVFGWVTALPALLVLAGVVALGLAGRRDGFVAVLLLATMLAGGLALILARRAAVASAEARGAAGEPWNARELWRVSVQSWSQAALGGLLGAGLLSLVAALGRRGEDLGAASLGLHLYQIFAALAGYVAPLLFDRLARQAEPSLGAWPREARLGLAALSMLSVLGLAVSGLEPAWRAWLLPLALMLLAGVAAVAARLAGTVLLARGEYAELSLQAFARLVIVLAVAALALPHLPAAAAVAVALLAMEAATWWRTAAMLKGAAP